MFKIAPEPKKLTKVLFVNPFGIGDALFSLRVAQALKNEVPDVQIDFVGNERTHELLKCHNAVREVYEFNRDKIRSLRGKDPLRWAGEYRDMIDAWRGRRYSAMIDLSLGREFAFLGFCAGIPVRAGLDHKGRGSFLNKRVPFKGYEGRPVTDFQKDVVAKLGVSLHLPDNKLAFEIPADASDSAKRFFSENGIAHDRKLMIAPGGGKSWGANAHYKQWDLSKFIDIAKRWVSFEGAVVILGDESEKDLVRALASELPNKCVAHLGYSLPDVMAVLKSAHAYLGNDGGLSHLANALGLPSAVIFGPVDQQVYAPQGKGIPLQILSQNVPCRPCYHRFHFPPCAYERRCLTELTADTVWLSLKKIT